MTEIEEYSKFLQYCNKDYLSENFAKKFRLKYIGCGISRLVFKKDYSREVIKVAFNSSSNLAEYALYQSLNGCKLQSLFAKCQQISNDGKILIQEFVAGSIPDYALGGTLEETREWHELQTELENQFAFIKNFTKDKYTICDMHPDNIRLARDGSLKIIDYAAPLDTIVRQKKFDLQACISKLARYTRRYDREIKFYLNAEKQVVLDLGKELIKMPSSKHLIA